MLIYHPVLFLCSRLRNHCKRNYSTTSIACFNPFLTRSLATAKKVTLFRVVERVVLTTAASAGKQPGGSYFSARRKMKPRQPESPDRRGDVLHRCWLTGATHFGSAWRLPYVPFFDGLAAPIAF